VPKLYVQVCHLMNKMNLPPPFTLETHPVLPSLSRSSSNKRKFSNRNGKINPIQNVNTDVEFESEEDSDTEDVTTNQNNIERGPNIIQHNKTQPVNKVTPLVISTPASVESINDNTIINNITTTEMQLPSIHNDKNLEKDNVNDDRPTETSNELEESKREYLSEEEIKKGRMDRDELLRLPVYHSKGYEAGDPSNKLFMRSLPKDITKQQIEVLFGRFFKSREEMKEKLEINVLGGRMKGQAFVTFPSVEMASLALEDTLGYIMDGKPILMVSPLYLFHYLFLYSDVYVQYYSIM
jgi:U11/U12 small nuclear ribonucleoprotein 65 kDa protein